MLSLLLSCESIKLINFLVVLLSVAFKVYDIDQDGYISNGELFQVR